MVEITWLGHGTMHFRLENGESIVIDPWLSNPRYPQGFELTRADTVLLTHGHFDHVADAASVAKKFGSTVVSNFEIGQWLNRHGVTKTTGMNKGGTTQAGSIRVTMTHALHSSGIQEGDELIYGGEAAGYILHFAGGRNAYFAGDTAVFSDMALYAELYAPQLVFLPIGDFYTMSPTQAALACRLLKAPKAIPMHFGTFPVLTGKPSELAALAKDTEVWELTPGETVKW